MTDDGNTERAIDAARAGDSEALGRLLESCRNYLLAIAGPMIGDDLTAKVGASDLVQDALLGASRDFARFQGTSREELLAWLRAILQNAANVSVRRFRGTQKRQLAREIAAGVPGADGAWDALLSGSSTPGARAVRHEEIEAVQAALSRLREVDRRVVLWRQYDGLSFDEIGERLGRTGEAARKLWSRALVRLTTELARNHDVAG